MKTAQSIPPNHADSAMQLAARLLAQSTEHASLAQSLERELELTGELPRDFVKKLEKLMAGQQETLDALTGLATSAPWTE